MPLRQHPVVLPRLPDFSVLCLELPFDPICSAQRILPSELSTHPGSPPAKCVARVHSHPGRFGQGPPQGTFPSGCMRRCCFAFPGYLTRPAVFQDQSMPDCIPFAPGPLSGPGPGSGMVRAWFRSGSGLVQLWFRSGSNLNQVWFRSGSNLVQVWFKPGSGLVQVWFRTRTRTRILTVRPLGSSEGAENRVPDTS